MIKMLINIIININLNTICINNINVINIINFIN